MKQFTNKILVLLNSIGKDKFQHDCLGSLIFCLTFLLSVWFLGVLIAVNTALVVTVGFALFKDFVLDEYPDYWDIAVTIIGGLKVYIPILATYFIV